MTRCKIVAKAAQSAVSRLLKPKLDSKTMRDCLLADVVIRERLGSCQPEQVECTRLKGRAAYGRLSTPDRRCGIVRFFQRCVFITFIRLLLPAHKNSDVNTSQNLWLHAALLILFRGMNIESCTKTREAFCRVQGLTPINRRFHNSRYGTLYVGTGVDEAWF